MSEEDKSGLDAELELREHFAGKRGAPRLKSHLEVRLENRDVTLKGVAQDLSRSGVLVMLSGLVPGQFEEIIAWTSDQMKVRFVEPGIAVGAIPIRAVRVPKQDDVLIALQFAGFLTSYQRRALGLDEA